MFEVKLGTIKQSHYSEILIGDVVLYCFEGNDQYLEGEVVHIPKRKENQFFLVKSLGTESLMTLNKTQDKFYKIPTKLNKN